MTAQPLDRDHWVQRLADLAAHHQVPGAALGIVCRGETLEAAYGVANVTTSVRATTDTLFQIGSITKVWSATVIMALADSGKLDIDEPVVHYLPELRLADPQATREVTTRHLLTHTSGIDGDFFRDTGRGDDCLERYVAALAELPMNHSLGATWSYSNSGYIVLGRMIEKLTGQVWDTAMRELLYSPLGLDHTVTMPEEALWHTTAVGHVQDGDQEYTRVTWVPPRSIGPCGLILSSVSDVLTFAQMHLGDGLAANGNRVLTAAAVAAMQEHQVALPDPYSLADSWGLGWFRSAGAVADFVGHDGRTIGQAAFLRILPEQGMAVALLTNGGQSRDLYESLVREAFRELAGVEPVTPLSPPVEPAAVDITPHVGTYRRSLVTLEVWSGATGPRMRTTFDRADLGIEDEVKEFGLVPVRDGLFLVRERGAETWIPVTFYELGDGTPCVHFGLRAARKVS